MQALYIATSDTVRPIPPPAQDTLLFTFAKNGVFSVKKAYQLLKGDVGTGVHKEFWDWLWRDKGLTPKLKVFVWRCVHNAIPVRAILVARIQDVTPLCQLCSREPKTIMHALFFCDFPRAAWLDSPLGLRSCSLQGNFKEVIKLMANTLDQQQMCIFVSMTWAIWRTRNDATLGGKLITIQSCKQHFSIAAKSCHINMLVAANRVVDGTNRVLDPITTDWDNIQMTAEYTCYVDGSWSEGGMAGIGIYLLHHGSLVQWVSRSVQAVSPSKVEAIAVLEGYKLLNQWANGTGVVLSDSKETVESLAKRQPVINDWRSYEEVWNAWLIQANSGGELKAVYCNRENRGLRTAHVLANQGRMYGWNRRGTDELISDVEEFFTL